MACRICGSSAELFYRDQREFYLCSQCSFIFTRKGVQVDQEKTHYETQHSNEYDWLKLGRICLDIAGIFKDQSRIYRILDYGSGAGNLTNSLRLHGYHVDSYEPMYDTSPPANNGLGYDVIVLHEVMEHIEDIPCAMKTIYDVANDEAVVLVFTLLTDELLLHADDFISGFGSWWYKDDMTHVSFFSSLAFKHVCQNTKDYNFQLLAVTMRGVFLRVCKPLCRYCTESGN